MKAKTKAKYGNLLVSLNNSSCNFSDFGHFHLVVMATKDLFRPVLVSVLFVMYTQAMFFTTSKANDYPRIGKRLPASVYNNWLRRDDPEKDKDYVNALREIALKRQAQDSLYGKTNKYLFYQATENTNFVFFK